MDKKAETCGQKSEKIVDKGGKTCEQACKRVETCGQGSGDLWTR